VHPNMFVGPNPDQGAEGDNTKKRHAHGIGKPLTGGCPAGIRRAVVVCCRGMPAACSQITTALQRHSAAKDGGTHAACRCAGLVQGG
jgi:hypothetical protein